MKDKNLEIEANRFFDHYGSFCSSYDTERLNHLVISAYILNERLKRATYKKQSFGTDIDFFVIRSLRNEFTHGGELDFEVKGIGQELINKFKPPLGIVCLVPKSIMKTALNNMGNIDLIQNAISSWQEVGSYVDVYPFIYNFSSKLFEKIFRLKLNVSSEFYLEIKKEYKLQSAYGIDHLVRHRYIDQPLMPNDIDSKLVSQSNLKTIGNREERRRYPVRYMYGVVNAELFDMDIIIKDFIHNLKTLNGMPFELLPDFYDQFDAWAKSKAPLRIQSLLNIKASDVKNHMTDYGFNFMQAEEETRFKILFSKKAVIEKVYIALLNENNIQQFHFLIFCALTVSLDMMVRNKAKAETLLPFFELVLLNYDRKNFNNLYDRSKKKQKSIDGIKNIIIMQMMSVLVEYPYDEHFSDSII